MREMGMTWPKSCMSMLLSAMLLSGCSAMMQTAATDDGMYGVHDRNMIAERRRTQSELQRAEAAARESELAALLSQNRTSNPYESLVADTYESAYARRLKGFSSPSYRMPSSYYNLRYGGAFEYATAYDPAFYNIMVSGDQVWVEPKYISSMFGTWGAARISVGFGYSIFPYNWYYGWNTPYYGSWWGYPRYSWYDWNWSMCYNPYWGYGWHYGWGPGWHYGWHAPSYRPSYGSRPMPPRPQRPNLVNRPPYTSPSSGKTYNPVRGTPNGSGTYRPSGGSTVNRQPSRTGSGSGSYNNSNRGGSSSFFNNGGSSRPSNSGSSSRGGSSGYSGGHSSGGSSGGGGSRNSIGR